MESPIGTGLKLIGLGFLIWHFGIQNWFIQQYLKWRLAAPKQATQLEQQVQPVIQPIQQQLQQQPTQQATPTPQPSPTTKPYGVEFNVNTPIGSYNSQIQVAPGDSNLKRTRHDLGNSNASNDQR